MINKCPCCNSTPIEAGMISCQNIKCSEYDEKYFIWEWQLLTNEEEDSKRLTDSFNEFLEC